MFGTWTSLILLVSGGGFAATHLAGKPRSPAVPASVIPLRNLRRLNVRACWVLMSTSLLRMLVNVTPSTLVSGLFFPRV
jgi:hypothetical protein